MTAANTAVVVTTIQEPTECMRGLAMRVRALDLSLIVIGDKKGPSRYPLVPAEFVSLDEQRELPFKLARALPDNHYTRKNLGYLIAMAKGCECIYETDDDNVPMETWGVRQEEVQAHRLENPSEARWANVYNAYTGELVWPRGLPLHVVRRAFAHDFIIPPHGATVHAPIQQGLANGSPDVDAVWRLVLDHDLTFENGPNLVLPRGTWCPFNAQNTWWWKEAFPLMYLPSSCTFRMTDIWRSLVAQRCLWEGGYELEFHQADVKQLRNDHDLMRDFEMEITGYIHNERMRLLLESCKLDPGREAFGENLRRCYETLTRAELISDEELDLVEAWLDDCRRLLSWGGLHM